MILSFELSMPGVNSWNGKWSGEGKLYAIVKNLGKSKKQETKGREVSGESYSYCWDDGWRARINVREVDAKEARRVRNSSRGFCGYDWMVDSILNYGNIKTAAERRAEREIEVIDEDSEPEIEVCESECTKGEQCCASQ